MKNGRNSSSEIKLNFECKNMVQKELILRWSNGFQVGSVPGEVVITTF